MKPETGVKSAREAHERRRQKNDSYLPDVRTISFLTTMSNPNQGAFALGPASHLARNNLLTVLFVCVCVIECVCVYKCVCVRVRERVRE